MHVHTVQLCLHLHALTYEEKNALRFIAGYVSRKVYKKVQEFSYPERVGMVACIKGMIGGCSF